MEALGFRFAFTARDFESSVRFYRDMLGMPQVGGWDREDGKGALLSVSSEAVIEIFGAANGKTYPGSAPAGISLAIRLAGPADIERAFNTFRSANCRLDGPPLDQPWGHRVFIIYDPDGIPIHIYCELDLSHP